MSSSACATVECLQLFTNVLVWFGTCRYELNPPPPPHTHTHSHPPSAAYLRQWSWSALLQVMYCGLLGAKPSPEPMRNFVNWTLRNKLHWNSNKNTNIYHWHWVNAREEPLKILVNKITWIYRQLVIKSQQIKSFHKVWIFYMHLVWHYVYSDRSISYMYYLIQLQYMWWHLQNWIGLEVLILMIDASDAAAHFIKWEYFVNIDYSALKSVCVCSLSIITVYTQTIHAMMPP